MAKRVFTVVLDSFGIGMAPDAEKFGDAGANTLRTLYQTGNLRVPNLSKLGLFHLTDMPHPSNAIGRYGCMSEISGSKDTITGHWEMMGVITKEPFPVFPHGFPNDFIKDFESKIGHRVLCNQPYSGTEVLKIFGEDSVKKDAIIVYTSGDSVFQVAAHEDVISPDELYDICKTARDMLAGSLGVGRVIARPFRGKAPNFERNNDGRHDFPLDPPYNMLDYLSENGVRVTAIGKIKDIFNGRSIHTSYPNLGNTRNMEQTTVCLRQQPVRDEFVFVNLVDFDALYGHRRDMEGYVKAVNEFDEWLGKDFLPLMREDDYLILTADHGNDPGYRGTDHTRECVPMLLYSPSLPSGESLGSCRGFQYVSYVLNSIFFPKRRFPFPSFE